MTSKYNMSTYNMKTEDALYLLKYFDIVELDFLHYVSSLLNTTFLNNVKLNKIVYSFLQEGIYTKMTDGIFYGVNNRFIEWEHNNSIVKKLSIGVYDNVTTYNIIHGYINE